MTFQPKDNPDSDGKQHNNQSSKPSNNDRFGFKPRQFRGIAPRGGHNGMTKEESMELHQLQTKRLLEKEELFKARRLENENQLNANSRKEKLPEEVQAKMENSFNTVFKDVNITQNSKSAEELGAQAFAQGNDVHFAPGQYKPNTTQGQELIGHELTHVVQQKQGRVKANAQAKGVAINDDPALEKEADVMGKKAAGEERVAVQKQSKSGDVQRRQEYAQYKDQSQEINYEPHEFASDLRELNSKIEMKFNGALDQFERALQMKKTTPDYLNVTWSILKSEVIGATGAIPVYGTYLSKALTILDKYYTEYKKAESNAQHNQSINFSLNQGDLINERSKLLNEAVNISEQEYINELSNLNGSERKQFMQATYNSFKVAYTHIIENAQDNIEIGFYKSFLSDIRGELYIGFSGDWLNPILETVKITKSGHDVGITQRLNELYSDKGYIPLNDFQIKKKIVHPNNMPGGYSTMYLDKNNNLVEGGESSKLILNEYWKSTTKPLKSVISINGIKLPIPITLD